MQRNPKFIDKERHQWLNHLLILLERSEIDQFFSFFSKDATWTMEGHNPLTGSYRGIDKIRSQLFEAPFLLLRHPVKFNAESTIIEANMASVVIDIKATAKNGKPFHNRTCWILRWDDKSYKVLSVSSFANDQALTELYRENTSQRASA